MRYLEAVVTSVPECTCQVGKLLDYAWTASTSTLVMFLSTRVLSLYSGSEGRRFDEGLVKCWGMYCWEKIKECRSNFCGWNVDHKINCRKVEPQNRRFDGTFRPPSTGRHQFLVAWKDFINSVMRWERMQVHKKVSIN